MTKLTSRESLAEDRRRARASGCRCSTTRHRPGDARVERAERPHRRAAKEGRARADAAGPRDAHPQPLGGDAARESARRRFGGGERRLQGDEPLDERQRRHRDERDPATPDARGRRLRHVRVPRGGHGQTRWRSGDSSTIWGPTRCRATWRNARSPRATRTAQQLTLSARFSFVRVDADAGKADGSNGRRPKRQKETRSDETLAGWPCSRVRRRVASFLRSAVLLRFAFCLLPLPPAFLPPARAAAAARPARPTTASGSSTRATCSIPTAAPSGPPAPPAPAAAPTPRGLRRADRHRGRRRKNRSLFSPVRARNSIRCSPSASKIAGRDHHQDHPHEHRGGTQRPAPRRRRRPDRAARRQIRSLPPRRPTTPPPPRRRRRCAGGRPPLPPHPLTGSPAAGVAAPASAANLDEIRRRMMERHNQDQR